MHHGNRALKRRAACFLPVWTFLLWPYCHGYAQEKPKINPINGSFSFTYLAYQQGNTIVLLDRKTEKVSARLPADVAVVVAGAFSHDDAYLCVSLKTGKLVLYDVRKEKKLWTVDCQVASTVTFAKGDELAKLSKQGEVVVIHLGKGLPVQIREKSDGSLLRELGK